ncbi:hypothetical protein GCM10010168_00210 [Actinoplanes ianthinogenes]|uniref:Tetratricopeptide repeat protein n=2 Tax=Actinoplanes ianthinogenes TaxID=122358 RepID=A0ABN6CCJ1_9ACTN|nr:hypothetical protein Aiant_38940 [Actinoplanes ianthinogenes]GGQ89350.1 hypothetical protein GCM10010168_00210 [Actinoplanes ianthinogenes]
MEPDTTPEDHRQRALLLADLGRYDEAADEIAAGLSAASGGSPGDTRGAASGPGATSDGMSGSDAHGGGAERGATPDGAAGAGVTPSGPWSTGPGGGSAGDSGTGAAEIALLATLARIHLAAEQPVEALAAAERAAAAAPGELSPLVVRAMALTDSRRYAEAAQLAGEILRAWPEDPYAQRTGAALLSESRNGQEALNAAWNGVRVAPADAEAHLVLAVVAARLRLFDLAQRAYAESLDLDPAIGDAGQDIGIVRLERRRWARALEELAEEASLGATPAGPVAEPPATPPPARPSWSEPPAVSRPRKAVLDMSGDSADAVRETIRYGANGALVAAVLTAAMTLISSGISRVWAGLIGFLVFLAVVLWFRSRLTEPAGTVLARLRAVDRRLLAALYLTFAAPLFLVAYALVGGLPTLIAGMVLAAIADLLVLTGRR